MYYLPYLPKTQPAVHSAFEINAKARVQEKKEIDLAAWYLNKMSSKAPARPIPFQKLFKTLVRFIEKLHIAPHRELAPSSK